MSGDANDRPTGEWITTQEGERTLWRSRLMKQLAREVPHQMKDLRASWDRTMGELRRVFGEETPNETSVEFRMFFTHLAPLEELLDLVEKYPGAYPALEAYLDLLGNTCSELRLVWKKSVTFWAAEELHHEVNPESRVVSRVGVFIGTEVSASLKVTVGPLGANWAIVHPASPDPRRLATVSPGRPVKRFEVVMEGERSASPGDRQRGERRVFDGQAWKQLEEDLVAAVPGLVADLKKRARDANKVARPSTEFGRRGPDEESRPEICMRLARILAGKVWKRPGDDDPLYRFCRLIELDTPSGRN